MRPIRAHLNYISRNGQLPVETQDGEHIVGHGDLATLAGEWERTDFQSGRIQTAAKHLTSCCRCRLEPMQ